jgi:hypothetical protein
LVPDEPPFGEARDLKADKTIENKGGSLRFAFGNPLFANVRRITKSHLSRAAAWTIFTRLFCSLENLPSAILPRKDNLFSGISKSACP